MPTLNEMRIDIDAKTYLDDIKKDNPDLDSNGWKYFERRDGKLIRIKGDPIPLKEFETAVKFLLQKVDSKIPQKRKSINHHFSSYGLKHLAEKWGQQNGMNDYVSNGALIAAAMFLGYDYEVDRNHSYFNISHHWIRKMDNKINRGGRNIWGGKR